MKAGGGGLEEKRKRLSLIRSGTQNMLLADSQGLL